MPRRKRSTTLVRRFIRTRREPEIEQRHQRATGRERRDRPRPVLRHRHFVLRRERPLHLGPDVLVVFDDEERGFRYVSSLTGKLTGNVVPLPGALSACM